MEEKTEDLFEELGKCIGTNANGVIEITDSKQFCKLLDNHTEPFTKEEMVDFFYLFWQNISIICGAGAEEDLNKKLTDSLNNNAKVRVNDEYKVFDEEVLPHVIEKMNFNFETEKPISGELFGISVIDVYEASKTGNNEEEEEKKGENIPAYLQFILIFFALCKYRVLTETFVLNKLLSECNFSFTDEIMENFISCCGDKVFQRRSLKTFFSKFDKRCKLSKEQCEQLMQCSADNAFDSEILGKFFNGTEKVKFDIDLIEKLLRCSDKDSFNEEILRCFLKKCNAEELSLNAMKNLIKCCPNEIFTNNFSKILTVYEKKTFDKEILNTILNKYNKEIKLDLNIIKNLIKMFSNKIFKNSFPEILEKCPAKIFDCEFANKILEIKNIIFSKEIALKFLKCCNEEVFNTDYFERFKMQCEFEFDEEIILELIRVSDKKTIECKLSDIKTGYKGKSLNENILKAVLCKFENGEISSNLLDKFLECFPAEVIQNNLINILEKCAKKVLCRRNLKKLLDKLSAEKSSEKSVIWIFSNFPDESVKKYLCEILLKLKGISSNEEFLNLVLEKGNMSNDLLNLLFKKFGEGLLKERLADILKNCSDNSLSEENYDQILVYFKKDEIPDEAANELVRCVNSIDWIFNNFSYYFAARYSNEEFLKAILKKIELQSRAITSTEFNKLLDYFSSEVIRDNLIDILQNLEKEEYLSGDVLNEVLDLYEWIAEMPKELLNFLFENFAKETIKENLLNILSECEDNTLDEEILKKFLNIFGDEKISDELAKELIRCCNGKIFDSALINKFAEDFRFDKVTINKFLNNCNENFHFDETTTEKFYKCFEKQSVTSEILVKLLNRGFQFDIEVCKEDNFQIFDIDIFTSKNYKELCKALEDKSAIKNFAALYNSYNKSNIKIGYGIGIGIGLLTLLIAGGLSIATFGLGALAVSGVMIAAIAVTAAVGLTVTSVFSSFIHMLRLSLAMAIKNFIEQKYQEDNSIDVKKEMEEKIAPDLRFWLKVNESKSKKINTKNEIEQPLLENHENQID